MQVSQRTKSAIGALAGGVGVAAVSYAACVGASWWRFGHPSPPDSGEADEFLDRFMPCYDVVERHQVVVDAPADITYEAATELDFQDSAVVRAIFKTRALALRAEGGSTPGGGIVAVTSALGWRVLTEVPGREIVMGAVTQPWIANPVFRGIPPDEFARFSEPGYVKIVWTLRADPVDHGHSTLRSETRAVATDDRARKAFRRYWAYVSPGIWVIREIGMHLIKKDAESRDWRAAARAV
jgi:hypothetical protein